MPQPTSPLQAMQTWVETWVIGQNLCPFARPSVEKGGLLLRLAHGAETEARLLELIQLVRDMEQQPEKESALLVLPQLVDFDDFLDELALAEALLETEGLHQQWQLASFHPDYRFEGEAAEDASHYTNRSPCPAWHLLRESVMSRATVHIEDPLAIPERNMRRMRALGVEQIKRMLAQLNDEKDSESAG